MTSPVKVSHVEFERLLALPENADCRLELIEGRIEERMGNFVHGIVIANFIVALKLYLRVTGWGYVSTDARFSPDHTNDFRPDVSLVPAGTTLVNQGAMPGVPWLAIEVQSPGQSDAYMEWRAQHYLALGVRMVWLAYPAARRVVVHTADNTLIFNEGDRLTVEDVLPGFGLPIVDVFAEM